MAKSDEPVTIKKYANRRLYNTGTSTYVTLEDLAAMVKEGEDFIVYDAKSGDDITRSVLAQIIFEQENKQGQNLLPTTFLRQLIRFYGDSMQMLVPRFLEASIDNFTRDQDKFRKQMSAFGTGAFPGTPFALPAAMEEQVRRNMELFERTFSMFQPFKPPHKGSEAAMPEAKPGEPAPEASEPDDIDALRRQMQEMQSRLEQLSGKKPE
jgi:polyhydroxyalkanoate synthesis repressor PhaR